MKPGKLLPLIAALALSAQALPAAIVINDFSNLTDQAFSPFGLSWSGGTPEVDQFIQGSGNISIAPVNGGNPLGDGNFYAVLGGTTGSPFAPQDFTLLTDIQVTARLDSGNASGGFILTLVDSTFTDVGSAVFSVSLFTSSFSTASASLVLSGDGSISDIQYFRISGDGDFNAFRMSFDNATAVPEPSTCLLLGLGAAGLLGSRRKLRR